MKFVLLWWIINTGMNSAEFDSYAACRDAESYLKLKATWAYPINTVCLPKSDEGRHAP